MLQTAADRGHAGAQRELAFYFDEWRGVARDANRAAVHLLAALAAGHKKATQELLERPRAWSYSTHLAIQRKLARRSLYRGAAHGIFNKSTKSAPCGRWHRASDPVRWLAARVFVQGVSMQRGERGAPSSRIDCFQDKADLFQKRLSASAFEGKASALKPF